MDKERKNKILTPKGILSKGVFLPHLKATAEFETVTLSDVKEVKIPLKQHIGVPTKPIVKKGDKVFVGTLIAEKGEGLCAPVHSSVSGTVKAITKVGADGECIVIESDGLYQKDKSLKAVKVKTKEDLVKAAEGCGLVGLGGAGFPTSVKLNTKGEIETLIINAAECEPYITVDYRECIENYEDIVNGVCLVKDILNIPQAIICIESNKSKAIEQLSHTVEDKGIEGVKIMQLPTLYPQGAEKMIVYSATGKKVPIGKLPSDVGCIVMNVTSIATLYRYVSTGMPLVSRRITVDGTAVSEPKIVTVPIGTPISDILEFVGITDAEQIEVISGGPMMGVSVTDINSVINKRNNAITVLNAGEKRPTVTACIRCGRCVASCPMQLYPGAVEKEINHGRTENLKELNINCCIECGCCSFVCPAKRPLAKCMRIAKETLRRENNNGK